MSTPTAAQVLDHVNHLVGCLSTVCEDGRRLRDFPPDFSPVILKDIDAKLKQASSYVKTIANSYAPINRIPVEVLNSILRLTIDPIPNFRPTLPRDPYYGTVQELVWPYRYFTLATRVCRYWHTVTVQFAANWSTIQIFGRPGRQVADTALSSKFASLCLNRAATSPLDIALYMRPTDAWRQANLLEQMHRFRLLVIDDVDVLPNLSHPAPLLQSLTIEPTWRSGGRRPPATIPLLFGGHAPSLRYLSIRYFVPWPANSFSDLTHLCLQGDGTSSPYNFSQFIEFLASTPKLQELILAFVEGVSTPRDDSDRIAVLNDLRRLAFYNCSQPVISRTLSHITLSSHTVLAIRFQRHGGWRPDHDLDYFACIPEDVPRVLNPLALSRFCMLQDDLQTNCVRFVGCASSSSTGNSTKSPSAFDLYPGLAVGGLGRQVPTTNVSRLLRGCAVEELWTSPLHPGGRLTASSWHPVLDQQVWRVLFYALPALHRLVLGDIRPISDDDDDDANDGCMLALSDGVLCPQLVEVWVDGCWTVRTLCRFASQRSAAGKPIQRVVFRQRPEHQPPGGPTSGLFVGHRLFWEQAADIEELRQIVGRVDFIEFEDFSVSLPDTCFQSRHAYWGSWRNSNTL